MIELIDELPDDTLGVRLVGKIEAQDYGTVLIPALEAAHDAHETVNVLAIIGPDFDSYTAAALWDDAKYGVGHMRGWGRFAIVSDHDWVHHLSGIGKLFYGRRLRLFAMAELDDAKTWLAGGD
jgi:SpoIIAA-like